MTLATAKLGELMSACGNKAGKQIELPVYSVTKHEGFVRSLQYFKKQVYSRDLSNYILVRNGDFAYATIHLDEGSIGIASQDCLISPMYTTFRTNSRVNPRYLLRFLKSPRAIGEYPKLGKGSVHRRKSISLTSLSKLQVPLPTLEEQQRIAQVLDQVDALRAKRRAAIARLDELAQSLFLDMFGDPVTNPMGWPRLPLTTILKRIDSGKSPKCMERSATPEEWGVLKLSAITSGTYNEQENKALHPYDAVNQDHEVKAGDILFSRKNTPELVAATTYVKHTRPGLLLPDLIFRLVIKDLKRTDPQYMRSLLAFPSKRRKLRELASGSSASMSNISKSKLLNFECEIPPLAAQQSFRTRLHEISRLRTTHQTHLAKLDELFASLQYRAFRGELFDSPN